MCRQKWKQTTGRVGVVVITIASHAIGRGFNPRIRYFSFLFSSLQTLFYPFYPPCITLCTTKKQLQQLLDAS